MRAATLAMVIQVMCVVAPFGWQAHQVNSLNVDTDIAALLIAIAVALLPTGLIGMSEIVAKRIKQNLLDSAIAMPARVIVLALCTITTVIVNLEFWQSVFKSSPFALLDQLLLTLAFLIGVPVLYCMCLLGFYFLE